MYDQKGKVYAGVGHCHTWLSNDGHTKKETDHTVTNTGVVSKSDGVRKGTELPANTDRLVIAETTLWPKCFMHKPTLRNLMLKTYSSILTLSVTTTLSSQMSSPFWEMLDDEEAARFTVRDPTISTAKKTVSPKWTQHRPWLFDEVLSVLDKKAAKQKGDDTLSYLTFALLISL